MACLFEYEALHFRPPTSYRHPCICMGYQPFLHYVTSPWNPATFSGKVLEEPRISAKMLLHFAVRLYLATEANY